MPVNSNINQGRLWKSSELLRSFGKSIRGPLLVGSIPITSINLRIGE